MQKDGYEPILKHSRWCLLKRWENLTDKQDAKLKDLLQYNLTSVRAYLLKEDFDGFWEYVSPAGLGGEISGPLVYAGHAIENRTHGKSGPVGLQSQATYSELVQGEKGLFQWHCRGLKQQSKSHYQKFGILHFSVCTY